MAENKSSFPVGHPASGKDAGGKPHRKASELVKVVKKAK